jgi:3-hydroxyisobutyrate dehydrogenase-like beta-hydroxyacid dehydrogenase
MPRSIAAGAIAFIGFGEAALAFLDGWRTAPGFAARVSAYDVKTDSPDPAVRAGKRADYVAANVIGASTAPGAVAGADAIFSVVTADQAHEAAVRRCPASKGARSSSTAIPVRRKRRSARRRRWTPRAGATSTSR